MPLGTKTLTGGASTEIAAEDEFRDHILIQLQSDHPTYLGFGETAITLQGIALLEPGATVKVTGPKARDAVNGFSSGNAVIGFETMEGIEYVSGQFAGPWPA